jgi:hypothetical protein
MAWDEISQIRRVGLIVCDRSRCGNSLRHILIYTVYVGCLQRYHIHTHEYVRVHLLVQIYSVTHIWSYIYPMSFLCMGSHEVTGY